MRAIPIKTFRSEAEPSESLDLEDFICVCSEGGRDEADKMMKDVFARLGCSGKDLLSSVVISLNWDYDVTITGIYNDQWSVIHASSTPMDGMPQINAAIQCDLLEHGVARLWQMVADLYVFAKDDQTR